MPIGAYGIGLHYNRAMFEEAGLDPDAPPTTWDEVREAAAAISEATGQAGFAQMSQDNTGGWMLTTLSYAFGGRLQEETADGVDVTIDNPGTIAALEFLQALRWEDNSMGSNFLLNWGTINQAFAAGQVGMYMGGSDVYNSLVTENDIDPATYGLTVIPLEGADAGVLGGGTDRRRAGRRLGRRARRRREVDRLLLHGQADQRGSRRRRRRSTGRQRAPRSARRRCRSSAPSSSPSPMPGWPSLVNVPQEQMAPFKDSFLDQPLIPEPPAHTQEMYAILDTVVQTVLTEEDADIAALLAQADADVTALVEAAADQCHDSPAGDDDPRPVAAGSARSC